MTHGRHPDLIGYLDGDLDPVETFLVDEHLERCLACRRKVSFERSLMEGMRSRMAEVCSPPALRQRVHALIAGF